jgi:hypothetical protein
MSMLADMLLCDTMTTTNALMSLPRRDLACEGIQITTDDSIYARSHEQTLTTNVHFQHFASMNRDASQERIKGVLWTPFV